MPKLTITISTDEADPAKAGPVLADLVRMVASRIDGSRDVWQGGRLEGPDCSGLWGFGPEPGIGWPAAGRSEGFDEYVAAVAARKADFIRRVMADQASGEVETLSSSDVRSILLHGMTVGATMPRAGYPIESPGAYTAEQPVWCITHREWVSPSDEAHGPCFQADPRAT